MNNGNPWEVGGYDGSQPGGPGDDFADLDSFSGDYRPEHNFRLNIDSLADDNYDLEIASAVMDRAGQDRICRITLKVAGGGTVEWTHWLNRKGGLNNLCAELAALG